MPVDTSSIPAPQSGRQTEERHTLTTSPTEVPGCAVGLVESLLRQGRETGASDIHLNPSKYGMEVLMRRDGSLVEHSTLPPEMMSKVVGRLKVMADLMVYRTDIPQEGRIALERTGIDSEVRVSTYPTMAGEKVSVRLDAQHVAVPTLETAGLPTATWRGLTDAFEQPEGLVLLTGPSGSGKTTTLYSCLHHLTTLPVRRSIVSVEDPIERRIDGVVQTEINEITGLGYTTALRSIMRQDPDVILIGEIRDSDTASIALQAALTGHMVASTIHAGTAPLVFSRLMEMGIEPHAITSVILGVAAQRLLRRVCPAALVQHERCEICQGTGYSGRVLVSEWLPITPELREAVLTRRDGIELTAAAEQAGYRSLRDEAMLLVEQGITTEEEVARVLGKRLSNPFEATGATGSSVADHDPFGVVDSPRRRRRPGPVPPDAGRDVSGESAAAEGPAPVIPRPAAQPAAGCDAADGDGCGDRDEPDGGLREAGGSASGPLPVPG